MGDLQLAQPYESNNTANRWGECVESIECPLHILLNVHHQLSHIVNRLSLLLSRSMQGVCTSRGAVRITENCNLQGCRGPSGKYLPVSVYSIEELYPRSHHSPILTEISGTWYWTEYGRWERSSEEGHQRRIPSGVKVWVSWPGLAHVVLPHW